MIGLVVTGHGQFAPGLASAIMMVAGEQPAFTAVPFKESRAASYPEMLRSAIRQMHDACGEVLVLVDFLGGSPFNQAVMSTIDIDNVEVVTGANIPMLLDVLNHRADTTLVELAERAVRVGRDGIAFKRLGTSSEA